MPTLATKTRVLAHPTARIACILLIAATCVLAGDSNNKDRETYVILIQAVAADGTLAMEPGFYALVKLLATVFSGPMLESAFFFLVAAASIGLKVRLFARYGGSLFGCLAAYFSYYFLVQEVTQVRIGFAIALLYFSWFAYAERKTRGFLVYGVLATLFHYSCIIFVVAPVLFAARAVAVRQLTATAVCLFALFSIFATQQALAMLQGIATWAGVERVDIYFALLQEGVLAGISVARLIPHTALLVVALAYRKAWISDRITEYVFRIYVCGLLVFLAFWPIPAIAYRLSDLFLFSGIFLIGRLRRHIELNLYRVLVLGYTGMFLLYTIEFSGLFLST